MKSAPCCFVSERKLSLLFENFSGFAMLAN